MKPFKPERWWPEALGDQPSASGGENEMRYVYFAGSKRLAVDTGDGKVSLYDTGEHEVSGVQQSQSGGKKTFVLSGGGKEIRLADLKKVEG